MRSEQLFRALGDATRLRIMRLLGELELAIGELAQALGQSQPRVSRHVAILCDAGLVRRRPEGAWVFLDASVPALDGGIPGALGRLLAQMEADDPELAAQCADDRRRLAEIRAAREAQAGSWFARHAAHWDELRKLHSPDDLVEQALRRALEGEPVGAVLDVGTGTGRMAELFAPEAARVVALDKSLEMLRIARAKLQHQPAGLVELRQGDFGALPFADAGFDTVLLHQVLHFAHTPAAVLAEAARVTRVGGRVAVVDFATHTREELRERHAHARLGFADEQMAELLRGAGFEPHPPVALPGGELVVKIWLGTRTDAPATGATGAIAITAAQPHAAPSLSSPQDAAA